MQSRGSHLRLALLFVLGIAIFVSGSIGRADESDDNRKREQLTEEINRHLDAMVYALRGVASSSSGDSAIDQSRSEADNVRSKALSLRDVARDDTAKKMANDYPDYADRFRDAAAYLKMMKVSQKVLDDFAKLCEDRDRELDDKIKRYVERNDPKGSEDIPKLALELGRPISERWNDADRKRSDMQQWRDRAKNFSDGDGKWNDIKSQLRDDADQIYDYFNAAWERSRKQCNDLNKQDKHPAVEQALKLLMQGEKGRQELYQELDRKLTDIARTLDSVAQDTSPFSEIGRATNLGSDLQSSIDRLSYVKGEDRKAQEMANNWPRYSSAYRDTLVYLKTTKEGQFRLDSAPKKCGDMKAALENVVKQYDKDPNGIDDIEKLAREQAAMLASSFSSAGDVDSRMQSARSSIGGFSISDGKWRDVAVSFKRTTDAIWSYWQNALKNAHDACDALALGDKNPYVVQAIKTLTDHAGSTIDTYQREIAEWRERVRVYKRRDCDELTRLWEALCGPLDYEPNEDEDKAAAWALSNQIIESLVPGVAALLSEYDVIKRRGEELQKKTKTQAEATKILSSLLEDKAKLDKLQVRTGWKGSNNPLVQFYISYGIQQHGVMMGDSRYSCDAKDVTFFSNKRPDCVSASQCTVFEFKPNNSTAISNGNSKLGSIYVPEVTRYYQEYLDKRLVPDSDHGGEDVMRKLAGKCLSNGKVELRGQVETYERCERRYECVQ